MGTSAKASVKGTTRIVGILGDPIDHTLSPAMHNAAYAALGLDYAYVPFRTSLRGLRGAVRSMESLGIVGFNVTVPFKERVMRYVDRTSESARAIGAVNTVWRQDGKVHGDNTDAPGFLAALRTHGVRTRGKRVLVVGAGGSARAIVYALTRGGVKDLVVTNRTLSKARRLLQDVAMPRDPASTAGLEILKDLDFLATRQLVINCTSVGLDGRSFLDYDASATAAGCVHFDLAYGRTLTPFLRLASRARRPTIDGRHMLVHQGALAFKIFTGRKAPVDAMLRGAGL